VTNFAKFQNDAQRLLTSAGGALVTTMVDYYGLPSDFPRMNTRPPNGTPLQRVLHVEAAIAHHFGASTNFLPFLALHEFEAWLFSSPTELPRTMNEPGKQSQIDAIRTGVATPEEITLHGPTVAARIGLERIRAECPHFNDWLTTLEVFATSEER
jgi:hypothetical protein